jgi:hypothetical protein
MTIRFYATNLVNEAIVTGTNEDPAYPATNIQDERTTKEFRSTTNADYALFNLIETQDFDSVIIVENSQNGFGFNSITFEGNATDEWTSPDWSLALTMNETHGIAWAEFTQESHLFVRALMSSSLGYCALSNVFIGNKIAITNDRSINYGWTYVDNDLSTPVTNDLGQRFIEKKVRRRQIDFRINLLDKDQLDQIFELYDLVGQTKPFFVRVGCDEMINDKDRFMAMVYFTQVPVITNSFFNRYDLSFSLVEAK